MAEKKVALVTGAGMGIGKAIAERLARDGFALAINDITADVADSTAEELRATGASAMGVQANVSSQEQVIAMVDEVVASYGRLDVMVSNAGIVQVNPIMEITEADFDQIFAINVKGVIWCAQAAAKQMMTQGGGKIINAASAAAHHSNALLGTYGATKFSVRSLTQVMAQEFAPHNITVNAYCPGIVGTGMWETIDSRASEVMGVPRGTILEKIKSTIPLGRMQTPEDVAKFVSFLACEDSDYITGQSMLADGGMIMI